MTKALIIPFYSEGYRKEIYEAQIKVFAASVESLGISVDSSSPVGTYKEAEALQKSCHPYSYDFVVLFPVTWSEPRLACVAARQFFGKPIIVWAINEFLLDGKRIEFSSAPAAAALYGCLSEMGVSAEFLTGAPQNEQNLKKLSATAKAAKAISALRNTKIGFFGHNFNGITAAGFDLSVLRRLFGIEVYSFDGFSLIQSMEKQDSSSEEYKKIAAVIDENTSRLPNQYRDKVIRMTLALSQFIDNYDLQAVSLRCHTEFSQEYGLTACLPLSILGNRIVASCEADLPVLVTEIIFAYLSGEKVVTYADLRTFTNEGMDIGACGFAPTVLTGGKAEVGGKNGYLTNASPLNEGNLTMGRLIKRPGGEILLHSCTGKSVRLSAPLSEYGCAQYPMAHIIPNVSMQLFMENTGANHYALVYDDITDALSVFTKYCGIAQIGS